LSSEKNAKNFKELNSNGRPGCSQFLAVLTETTIKKPEGISEYGYNIPISKITNNYQALYWEFFQL